MTRKYLTIQSAYDAGRAARCAGVEKPDDACPYDRGSLRFSWWSGWYDEDTKRFLARLAVKYGYNRNYFQRCASTCGARRLDD